MDLLLENVSHEDLKKYLKEFYNYAQKKLNLDHSPKLFLKNDNLNSKDLFGKTGYYDPDNEEIHLFITGRHAKDIIRSFAHELVHHSQKLEGKNDNLNLSLTHNPDYASKDEGLREMERDAFERGNMIFRDWTDGKKMERMKMLNEKKGKMPSEKTIKDIKKSIKKAHPEKSAKDVKSAAYATAQDIKKGLKPHGKDKPMTEEEKAIAQAKADMKSLRGKDMKELEEQETSAGGAVESTESGLEENLVHPYPQLLNEKERLLGAVFNKREELVYQELMKRFIKK